MALFDINCHVLPGIDGGPATLEEGLEMLKVSARSGVEGIVATPDQRDVIERSSVSELRGQIDGLRRLVMQNSDSFPNRMRLRLGMENHLTRDLLTLYNQGMALPIRGTRLLLVRLPFNHYPKHADTVLNQLRVLRIQPIIAHPERNAVLQRDWRRLASLVEDFNYVQVSAGSILGHFGASARRAAEQFLRRGIVHAVASEMRTTGGTLGPSLSDAYEVVIDMVGEQRAVLLFEGNPSLIFDGVLLRLPVNDAVERGSPLARAAALFSRR